MISRSGVDVDVHVGGSVSVSVGVQVVVGDRISTVYGRGTITKYRSKDAMYEVSLGKTTTLFTKNPGSGKFIGKPTTASSNVVASAMELNTAYEAYEAMRKLNLEVECVEAGIVFTKDEPIDHHMCTKCLILKGPPKKKLKFQLGFPMFHTDTTKAPEHNADDCDTSAGISSPTLKSIATKNNIQYCLLCGSPTCSNHSSLSFRKQNITLCTTCIETLEFDFNDDSHAVDAYILTKRVNHLVDLYDRAILLLKYSSPFMIQVAASLDQSMKHRNTVGVGASSAGFVSGALGVAAACSILTPAGPPLLIASLVFGGSASVVHTGSEAMRYFSEPHKLANRILALYGVVQSILHTTSLMRETTLVPYLDRAILILATKVQKQGGFIRPCSSFSSCETEQSHVEKALNTGVRIGSEAALVQLGISCLVQEGAAASRFITRASTNLFRTAQFAQFAGGALSAATLLLEVRQLTKTVQHLQKGSPCDKAAALRTLHSELEHVSSTLTVDSMCQSFVKVRAKQLATKRLLEGQHKLEVSYHDDVDEELMLMEEVVSSLEAQRPRIEKPEPYAPVVGATAVPTTRGRLVNLSKSSLLERVQRYKERDTIARAEICLVV